MKKLIVIGVLAISAVGFASGKGNGMGNGKDSNKAGRQGNVCQITGQKSTRKGALASLTPAQKEAFAKDKIAIEEKKLEVKKLMVSTTPDWKKVEKANLELATLRAKASTQMMKLRFDARTKAQAEAVAKAN